MTTYYARKEYIYSSGDRIFSIPFSYIKKEHIDVLINGESTENYTYLNSTQIKITQDLSSGAKVTIARTTPIDERMVIFSDTSILNKDTQNLAQEQVFDAIQEIYDNNEVFKIETNETLLDNKEELEGIISENREEILNIQEDFEKEITTTVSQNKADTDKQISDFEKEVDETLTKNKADTDSQVADISSRVDEAVSISDNALSIANTALNSSKEAVDIANNAEDKADNAIEASNKASDVADNATTTSNNALSISNNALTTANNATTTANEAKEIANNTSEKVDEFGEDIEKVLTAAAQIEAVETSVEEAKVAASTASTAADNAVQAASSATQAAQNAIDSLNSKQDTISDLDTIRSGAKLGATALQSVPDEYVTETELNAKGYLTSYTETDPIYIADKPNIALKSEVETKQDKLTAGTGIAISSDNVISNTQTSAEWGNIEGDIESQEDLVEYIKENSGTALPLFSTILMDKVLTYEETKGFALQGTYVYKEAVAGSRYGYPDFVAKCIEEKNAGTKSSVALGDNTITMYINSNGHKYYNISEKDAVDTWYNTYGIADFYGVDEENQRVFLPRNRYFMQLTVDTSDVNKMNEAGLPNIKGTVTSYENAFPSSSGAFTLSGSNGTADYHNTGKAAMIKDITFDASLSNSIYGNSDTVQPPSSNKLLYYVVGNTTQESSITDAIDVTTTENDTVPLGYSKYMEGIQPNASWLASNGQWNSGTLYTTFYNYYVTQISQKFANGYVKDSTDDYDDYDLVINQTDMTFRLPLLDGSEDILSDEQINYDLPSASGQTYTALYNGSVQFNATTSATNQYVRLQNITTGQCIEQRPPLSGVGSVGFIEVKKGDTFAVIGDAVSTVTALYLIKAQGTGTLYFKVANAVTNLELLDVGEVMDTVGEVMDTAVLKSHCVETQVIIDTYVSGTSGYRIWSDGYCEQWGRVAKGSTLGTSTTWSATVSLLKTMVNTNYQVTLVSDYGTASIKICGAELSVSTKTVTSFLFAFYNRNGSTTIPATIGLSWKASGYLAEGEY